MAQLRKLFQSLSPGQRVSLVAAILLVGGGLYTFTRWRQESDFKPLYSGISAEDAGPIVQKLKESGVEYRLSETGGTISVPSAKVPELRLEMAAAGLPRSGRIGFELFDKTNFGATDFVEHINYRRALEGELERSIQCLSEVGQARVHLTFPKDSVFLESRQPAKASVMIRLRPGARLAPPNVLAIAHLVGNAVEGLAPDAVTIVDTRGNLLSRLHGGDSEDMRESNGMLEFRQQVEKDLLTKINSTLEPLVGAEKFRAGVSVECDLTSGEESEESFDPARSVMLTSQKTEDVTTGAGAGGQPGTASNLPRPPAQAASSRTGMARRTENITYQSSRTVKKLRTPQGAVKRISISVLLDQGVRWEGSGAKARRVLVPPSPEMLKTVRDVVAGVSGLAPARGDQLVVETLPFESTLNQEPPEAAAPAPGGGAPLQIFQNPKWLVTAVLAGVVILVAVGGLLFILKRKRKKNPVPGPAIESATALGAPRDDGTGAVKEIESRMAAQAAEQARLDAETLRSIKLPAVTTKKTEVLLKQVRENVKADSAIPAQVLQAWIRERE